MQRFNASFEKINCGNLTVGWHGDYTKGRIIFYEEGRSEDFMGGPHFSEPKKGGGVTFFSEFNIKYFF